MRTAAHKNPGCATLSQHGQAQCPRHHKIGMTPSSPSLYVEQPGPLLRFWGLFRQACVASYEDNGFAIAKGAAYSSLLAFFPVLASIAAILVRVNADSVARVFSRLLFGVVPPRTADLG